MSFYGLEKTQQEAAAILEELQKGDCFPSAMLFAGPRYSGRMFAAMSTSKALGSDFDSTIIISDRNHNWRIKAAIKLFRTKKNNASRKFLKDTVMTFLSQYNGAMSENQSAANKKRFSGAADCMDILGSLDHISEDQVEKTADSLEKALSTIIDLKSGQSLMKMNSISVGQVRSIKEWAATSSLEGKRKTVIIEGLENSTSNAVNALLKTLEEPPKDTYFILISDNPGRMLATILSRVRRISFKTLGEEEKKYVLSSIFINPNEYPSLESFFIGYSGVNDGFLRETAVKVVKKENYDYVGLVSELEKSQAWEQFFSYIMEALRCRFSELKADDRRLRYLVDEINNSVSKARSFMQMRRMTLDFILFRIKEIL